MLGNYGKVSYGLKGPMRLTGNNSKSSTLSIPQEPKGQCLGNILEAKFLAIGCCFTPVSALFACMTFPAKLFCPGVLLSYSTSLHGHEMDSSGQVPISIKTDATKFYTLSPLTIFTAS